MGLSPSYLFSLTSFLDCLDDDQADVLWDNIEALEESEQDLTESGPHVFKLSGWGQPGPGRGKARARKNWDCWCALHQVPGKVPEGEDNSNPKFQIPLTVLEFELIHDLVNPIQSSTPPLSPDEAGGDDTTSKQLSAGGSTPAASVTTVDSDGTTKVTSAVTISSKSRGGLDGMPYIPTIEQFVESTQSSSKPIKAFQRVRRQRGETQGKRARPRRQPDSAPGFGTPHDPSSGDNLDMFEILSQVNEQLTAQNDLQGFLKVAVSLIREITGFSRVMIYQFDEQWNGQVVCELVDWNDTHDLYRGLHFPATDIPKQARDLYLLNKIRLLYDRDQPSARMVCREADDLKTPVDMTHSFLRAMSPIHIKYLANMGVRASMSISIVAFDQLWGLIALHTYGSTGKRVSFPMRQLCRLIGESVSRNIERLSYTRRLSARKLINTLPTDRNPSGYIISSAEDLLTLFDADFGVIAIGNEAKILGPLNASQEVLAVTEYLRIKKFKHVVTSQDVASDFPDMILPQGLQVIAGLLLVPLSSSGIDFITFLRKGQTRHVNWAGKPFKAGQEGTAVLEPRKSFKIWSETVVGTCRGWKDEELETASVLCLVYGKFISVWRQREQAMQYNQLNKLLLSNATHEVRTPLNHIINYLEMALDSQLDSDTRENLSKSHMASKSLLFVINDLLDLTRHEEGNPLLLQEPFDLAATIREAVEMHEWEAKRRNIDFGLETTPEKCYVLGDAARVRQVVVNTVSNSVKHTSQGHVHVEMRQRTAEEMNVDLPENCDMEIELTISDTGSGIPREKLEAIFREFEQVESVIADPYQRHEDELNVDIIQESAMASQNKEGNDSGLGLGLAIVARVVKNLGGQLRVDSTVGEGSRFTYYLPFKSATAKAVSEKGSSRGGSEGQMRRSNSIESGGSNGSSVRSDINSLVEAISAPHLDTSNRGHTPRGKSDSLREGMRGTQIGATTPRQSEAMSSIQNNPSSPARVQSGRRASADGTVQIAGSVIPLRSVKVDPHNLDTVARGDNQQGLSEQLGAPISMTPPSSQQSVFTSSGMVDPSREVRREHLPGFTRVPSQSEFSESASSTNSNNGMEDRRSSSGQASIRKKIAEARAKNAASSPQLPTPVSQLRVLVVEDDPINRMILKKRLALDGHIVMLAVNGEEGVRQFKENGQEMDVILMDLQMPICNGQDACRRIRACEEERGSGSGNKLANRPASHVLNGRIPIFAVSATLDFKMRQEMCDIGMDGWVLKPIDFNRLRSIMRGLTHVEQRERERWKPGHVWEQGGWLSEPANRPLEGGGNAI
jgi:light-regulated signal transduction histidine kinase (bacteriophytochrome)/CheY-like chemotaxis protein